MADPMEEEEVTDDEYRAALEALQSTISGKTRAAPKGPNDLTWEQQFDRLHLYLERLGMTESVNAMSYIHVAGTKGKGSTCAFVDACLRRAGTRTGLYTSPHLVDIRERYRIDGQPVSKTTFTRNFWWLHGKLRETCEADLGMPAYFRFLTLLGFRIFAERAVDAVVLEVGLGGRLDATNVIRSPAVCGVTSLGLDHVEVLGDTVGKIAREKAGIFKPRCPAITSPQVPEAMEALERRAAEVDGCSLTTARPLREWRTLSGDPIRLGLAGKHQELNAALAIELMRTWTRRTSPVWGADAIARLDAGTLPETWATGLAETEWFGRAQVVPDDVEDLSWYLDGAHTEESMRHVAEWFCGRVDGDETDDGGDGGGGGGKIERRAPRSDAPVQLHGGAGPDDAAHPVGADRGGVRRAHHRPGPLRPRGELEQGPDPVRRRAGLRVADEAGEDVGRPRQETRGVRAAGWLGGFGRPPRWGDGRGNAGEGGGGEGRCRRGDGCVAGDGCVDGGSSAARGGGADQEAREGGEGAGTRAAGARARDRVAVPGRGHVEDPGTRGMMSAARGGERRYTRKSDEPLE